ncbi:MAG: ribosome biogenesis GTPase Der, partial [Chloroflexi bacterium]|nr:ribosome biogenesis GTPase Der [Chloroflexota bacterium]
MQKPIVVIVGRPNVGKSTLFNRITGGQVAIVADLPGTTRDRIYADTEWKDVQFSLIDTGGLETGPESEIGSKVKSQVEMAIEEADVVIFLVDIDSGVTHMDKEIANLLRRLKKPVVLAANKSDNIQRSYQAQQFYELAIGDPIPISGYHDIGIGDLLKSVLEKLPKTEAVQKDETELLKIAVIGRPNVGKSMLVNAILGEERSIVSEIPGTTRDALDTVFKYKDEDIVLIDTGGIRRSGRVERGIERFSVMRSMKAIERADIALLVTDATDPIAVQDTHIAGYVLKAYKGLVIVVNKWDLSAELNITTATYIDWIKQRIKFFSDFPILFVSAKNKQGIDKVLEAATKVYHERLKRFPTSVVNGVIREAVATHAPRVVQGKRLKVLYVTQTNVNPPTFVFFVNDREIIHFSYQRYLENKLRDAFEFSGTPIKMVF